MFLCPEPGRNIEVSGHKGIKDDTQMMFNISIDESYFPENLDEFDSIRSVLLYRLVKYRYDVVTKSQHRISIHLFMHVANSVCCQRLD